jgi:hypothetical protein
MWIAAPQPTMCGAMLLTGSGFMDAERAFSREARGRRRAALARRLRLAPEACGRLEVYDDRALRRAGARPRRGIREIPIEAIRGTLEASKAEQFDASFRPAPAVRGRWQRIWLAEHRGEPLPPVSVVPLGEGYAIRDGHHRVSVARARGALTIDASVDAAA